MSIVTRTGDQGETSLMYGRRVPKTDARLEAYGCIDELSASLGLARAICRDTAIVEQILSIQQDLITLMGELATAPEDLDRYLRDGFGLTTAAMVDRLNGAVIELEKDKELYGKGWAIPGATRLSAALEVARAVCRRAERRVVSLGKSGNPEVLRYLNRLSDLCWLLARYADKQGDA